jgi:hypothetical protein
MEIRKIETTFQTQLIKRSKKDKNIKYYTYDIYDYQTNKIRNNVANHRKSQPFRVVKFYKAHKAINYINITRKGAKEWQNKNINE